MGRELECGEDFDVLAFCQHVLSKRLGDYPGIWDRTRGHDLGEIQATLATYPGMDTKEGTHDEASIELLPRPENDLSRPRGWELVGVFAQDEVDLSSTQLGLYEFTELVWVRIIEEFVTAVNDGDFLVL